MKVKLVGIHKVRAKLAGGEKRTYYYAWRGGPRMKCADPQSRAFTLEYIRLTRHLDEAPKHGTLSDLITDYYKSARFQSLAEKTRKNKKWAMQYVEERFHDLPIACLDIKGVRSEFRKWRDEYAATPRKADELVSALKSVLSFALDDGIIERNPLADFGKISDGTRKDIVWPQEAIDAFIAANKPHMVLAFELARWTGQRQGDLLKLKWSAYDGQNIKLQQGKTGSWVHFRVYSELRERLNATKRTAVTILTTERGRPWRTGFGASFGAAKEAAGLRQSGLHFHDLRGTFVTEAYKKGASIEDIADITGHSKGDAKAIIRKHYLASEAAVLRLETGTNSAANCKTADEA